MFLTEFFLSSFKSSLKGSTENNLPDQAASHHLHQCLLRPVSLGLHDFFLQKLQFWYDPFQSIWQWWRWFGNIIVKFSLYHYFKLDRLLYTRHGDAIDMSDITSNFPDQSPVWPANFQAHDKTKHRINNLCVLHSLQRRYVVCKGSTQNWYTHQDSKDSRQINV